MIGAAAIRERVASKLGWKDPNGTLEDDNEDLKSRRRRLSHESDQESNYKKLKHDGDIGVIKCENLVADEPKIRQLGSNEPILEQIKLAKRLLRDPKELLKAPESKGEQDKHDSEDDIAETEVKSYATPHILRAPPVTSDAESNPCMIQSNSTQLEKVRKSKLYCMKICMPIQTTSIDNKIITLV